MLRVLPRLVAAPFIGALILGFVTMLKEYSPAVFLGAANTNVLGTTMLELWRQGNTGSVAALATIQIVITAAFVGVASLLLRGRRDA
jgi:iron(III) transport system permease protein